MKCKKCGTQVDDQAKFCPVCGETLHADGFGGEPPKAPQPPRPDFGSQEAGGSYQYGGGQPGGYRPAGGRYKAPITSRSIPVAIILSIVTCGIYGIYWLYCMVNDLNTASGHENDTSGGMVILFSIITCNIYGLFWDYTAGNKVGEIQEYDGRTRDSYLGILYLLLDFFGLGIVAMALIQNELNKVAGL